ncbi:PGC-1 and ERR-induced regulator in muscle protein 1 [Camarhynchus parvulus]|uniref:PGC-1 and ERR-induced regulator in muscle protein 1 n=1 Tax=Geospiza parvula TaxID=87175 RepID=UPI0012381555|nr:PGC-1 and ERR-induced regulator in muscle protein 1 [Camarhynchus parvulus]
MDNFEYSIQLNDREWAEFLRASEECSLAPASLATAEEQSLSDIEQGDTAGRDRVIAARPGGEPAPPGTASPVPRGDSAGATRPERGQRCVPERLSGSEDEAELGSVGRLLCHSHQPSGPAAAAMPSAQRRQPPRHPRRRRQRGTRRGSARGHGAPGQGGACGSGTSPAGTARSPSSLCAPGARGEPVPRDGAQGGREPDKAGTEPGAASPGAVRPKVPAQPRKSRKQRGAGGAEGDRDPLSAAPPGKAPPGSPGSPRKGRAKDKAAKGALVRLGSEEAADNRRGDGGDAGTPKAPGRTKGTKPPKAGQAGASGGRDSVPAAPGDGPGEQSQEMPGKPLQPGSAAAFGGNAAEGAGGEPAAELPRAVSPLCFADGASGKPSSLDVTWPEMYEYLFCDSQEEEELGSSLEGRKSPLQREISWPELYEYFFTEPEGSRKKGKAKERKRKKFRGLERPGLHKEAPSSAPDKDTVVISVPDVHEHFFPEPAPNRMGWRGIFSMAPASEVKKAVGALRSLLQRQGQLGGGQAPSSQALVPRRSGEELALVPLGGAQGWPEDEDRALALRAAEEEPRVLSHKDMCLVFCAFASWAVKTSDLQAPDAWKTMFLASFGTLSAIRYFRRTVREGPPRS